MKKLPAERLILDGEIAALDDKRRSSFQLLQLFKRSGDVPLVYQVFDLLFLDGKDLREQPLSARRKALANLLKNSPYNIRLSEELRGSKDELVRVAQEFGLEGLVAERKTSVYESGRRSGAWVKDKITKSQEFVIGGYTLPEEVANISAPCSAVIKALTASCSPGESGPSFPTRSWQSLCRVSGTQ